MKWYRDVTSVTFAVNMTDMTTQGLSICEGLNIPRQSLIKTMLREAMDKYFTNKKMRKA